MGPAFPPSPASARPLKGAHSVTANLLEVKREASAKSWIRFRYNKYISKLNIAASAEATTSPPYPNWNRNHE